MECSVCERVQTRGETILPVHIGYHVGLPSLPPEVSDSFRFGSEIFIHIYFRILNILEY